MSKFYITTTLPYINGEPHIGFALEIIRADAIFRAKKLLGAESPFFNTGTDEHGTKIYQKALENNLSPQEYCDQASAKFKNLLKVLNISGGVNFIRTTDENHRKAAQEFWKICAQNGDIYKKNYKTKYCVGCELEKTDSELDMAGECPDHKGKKIEEREEENYFFRYSKYQEKLLNFYKENKNFVIPESRFGEIKAFVERGLVDFSISRLKSKMPWGIAVPGDEAQVMYVWFDALVNYISCLGWPENLENFNKYDRVVQYCGKDNLRQQAAMWQAMLFSAGLPNSEKIIINGFITSGGQKMSKTLGNVIDPKAVVEEYGVDFLRYFVLREVKTFEDSDVTVERLKDAYNSGLANGLGNLSSRVLKMAQNYGVSIKGLVIQNGDLDRFGGFFEELTTTFDHKKSMDKIWDKIAILDKMVEEKKPFSKIKINKIEAESDLKIMLENLYEIALLLAPFLPETSEKIKSCIENNLPLEKPLFLRK